VVSSETLHKRLQMLINWWRWAGSATWRRKPRTHTKRS